MKRICTTILACSINISCVGVEKPPSRWCFDGIVPNANLGREITSIEAIPISAGQIKNAFMILSRATVVEVDLNTAAGLTEGRASDSAGRYYLIRSGVFAAPGAQEQDLAQSDIDVSKRIFQLRESDLHLSVFVLQSINSTTLYDFPLLVRAPLTIRSAQAYCDTHH